MSDRFVFDSFALIAFYQREKGFDKVRNILRLGKQRKAELLLSEINLGEIYYTIIRKRNEDKANEVLANLLTLPIDFSLPKRENILAAAKYKSGRNISHADCFALELAISQKATLVTGDPDFRVFEKKVEILWL